MPPKKQHKGSKKRSLGIAVKNRFRVDSYFKTQQQIEQIDTCAAIHNQSRSQYVATAALQRCERDLG
jgi:uncharacterized protein (DUF1778 family)